MHLMANHQLALNLTWLLATLLASGCSLNNIGLASESHIELYKHAKIVTHQAYGLHLYTEPVVGIQLGYIKQRLVYPLFSDNHDLCIDQVIGESSENNNPSDTQEYSAIPLVVSSQQTGLGLSASSYHIRVNLGTTSRNTLRINQADSVSIYYINEAQQRDEDICAVLTSKPTDKDINDDI